MHVIDRTWVLLNPASGGGRGFGKLRDLEGRISRLGHVEIRCSRSAEELTDLACEAVRTGVDLVVACGGDGTVHYVAQGLVGNETLLGIVPGGRGNDIAANLGIPREPGQAVELLATGIPRSIDVGQVGSRYFLGVSGVGLDSRVNRFANRYARPWPPVLAYPLSFVCALPGFSPPLVRVTSEQGGFSGRITLTAVANMPRYGGGMKIAPQAECDNGSLDICLVLACRLGRLLFEFPRVYFGRHLASRYVKYWRSKSVCIESSEALDVYADGERIGQTPVQFQLRPRALRILVAP